jgi:hypothetical protein
MLRIAIVSALGLALVAIASPAVYAQELSTDEDRTIRQGDTIEWVSVTGGPHQVRFGGAVGATTLPKISEVQAILDFPPAPAPQLTISGDIGRGPAAGTGPLLTAKVKDDAAIGATFIFTCGIHTTGMLSQPFMIAAKVADQPARTFRIKGVFVSGQMHWFLEVTRDVQVDTN